MKTQGRPRHLLFLLPVRIFIRALARIPYKKHRDAVGFYPVKYAPVLVHFPITNRFVTRRATTFRVIGNRRKALI